MRRVAPNRAPTDAGSVEGGELGVRSVAPNRASTDTGSVEGGATQLQDTIVLLTY